MFLNHPYAHWIALGCAAFAAGILVVFLVRRPELSHATYLWLMLGLGVLPITVAVAGNIEGFEATKRRAFCGSCHVMSLHAQDSDDIASASLASRHARNSFFGANNCYVCHADYGMFGTVTTKLGGMRHVWLYYTEYRDMSLAQARRTIHLRNPYPNENCIECHSTDVALWMRIPDHRAALQDVRAERISCASAGCHGLAHPFFANGMGEQGAAP